MKQFRAIHVFRAIFMAFLIITLIPGIALSQQPKIQTKTMTLGNPGEMFLMKEFGGAISTTGDTTTIDMVLPPAQRHADYKELDIEAGDIIKIMNGKKISSASDIENIYKNLTIGDEIKLGIFRGKETRIVKFKKADPDELPAQMMIIGGPQSDNPTALSMISCGMIVAEKEGSLIIDGLINNMLVEFDGPAPQEGDLVIKIQGKTVKTTAELDEVFDELKIGDKTTLTLSRQGDQIKTAFKKPEPPTASGGQIKIKK